MHLLWIIIVDRGTKIWDFSIFCFMLQGKATLVELCCSTLTLKTNKTKFDLLILNEASIGFSAANMLLTMLQICCICVEIFVFTALQFCCKFYVCVTVKSEFKILQQFVREKFTQVHIKAHEIQHKWQPDEYWWLDRPMSGSIRLQSKPCWLFSPDRQVTANSWSIDALVEMFDFICNLSTK